MKKLLNKLLNRDADGIPASQAGKFNWDEKTVPKAKLSQCSDCQANLGANDCLVFKEKPDRFKYNEEVCESKIDEEE